MAKKAVTPSSRSPFAPALFRFLSDLSNNNRRDWFDENKSRYEDELLAPCLAFIESMRPSIEKISPSLLCVPKRVGGSLMRIYRDTRFSKDKTPYKTNVGIHFRHELGDDVHAPGLYVHLEPQGCFVAAGIWMPASEPLAAIRREIAEDTRRWNRIKGEKRFNELFKLSGESLKTAPRGFDPNHPAIEDLRRKSFAGIATLTDKEMQSSDAQERIVSMFQASKPLMKFLCDALELPL